MFRALAVTGLSGEVPVHSPVLGDNTMEPSLSGRCGGQVKRRVKDTGTDCRQCRNKQRLSLYRNPKMTVHGLCEGF